MSEQDKTEIIFRVIEAMQQQQPKEIEPFRVKFEECAKRWDEEIRELKAYNEKREQKEEESKKFGFQRVFIIVASIVSLLSLATAIISLFR